MRKLILFLFFVLILRPNGNAQSIDLAPSATLTTNGANTAGGAIARAFFSITALQVNQYITLDLRESNLVSSISFGTFWSSDGRFIPYGYNIDCSNDNSTWTNVVTVTNNTNVLPSHAVNTWARYWRLTVTATQSGQTTTNISGLKLMANGVGSAVAENFWATPWNGSNIFTQSAVGIGTVYTHGYKLAVAGSMIAESVKVNLQGNWPDYVFSTNHRLRSLGDLEKYIQTNRHLPEIPSAEEVKKDGIELGEMNAKLLKKIEELTLYVIEMDKKMTAQEALIKKPNKK